VIEGWLDRSPWKPSAVEIGVIALGLLIFTPMLHRSPAFLMAMIPMAAIAFAFVRFPAVGLILLLGARTLVDMFWWLKGDLAGLNILELYSAAATGLVGILVVVHLPKVQKNPYFLPSIPFVLVTLIAAVVAGDLRDGAEIAVRLISPIALMFAVAAALSTAELRKTLVLALFLTSLVPWFLAAWYLYIGYLPEFVDGYYRLDGGYASSHDNAHSMALFAGLGLLYLFHVRDYRLRILLWIYTIGCLVFLYYTYVRNPILGIAFFVPIWLWLEGRFTLLFAAMGTGALLVVSDAVFMERFGDIGRLFGEAGSKSTDDVGSGRVYMWSRTIENYLNQPAFYQIFGRGLGGQVLLGPTGRHDAHNDYLTLLCSTGIFSVLSYLWFQGLVLYHAWRVRREAADPWLRSFANMMIALQAHVTITNFTSNSYVSRVNVGWFLWALVGILFAESLKFASGRKRLPKETV